MDDEAVAAMLREDRAEWEVLVALLEAHPNESLHDPSEPTWNSRDIFAHFARWIERSTQQLEARLAGSKRPSLEGTDDEINARWQQEDSRLTLDEAREWAQRAFAQRIKAIEAVPQDRWDETLERIARADGADHFRGHRGYIVVD